MEKLTRCQICEELTKIIPDVVTNPPKSYSEDIPMKMYGISACIFWDFLILADAKLGVDLNDTNLDDTNTLGEVIDEIERQMLQV